MSWSAQTRSTDCCEVNVLAQETRTAAPTADWDSCPLKVKPTRMKPSVLTLHVN